MFAQLVLPFLAHVGTYLAAVLLLTLLVVTLVRWCGRNSSNKNSRQSGS